MQELYCYEMTDRDIMESVWVLSYYPGSRRFYRTLRFTVLCTAIYLGICGVMYMIPASPYRDTTLSICLFFAFVIALLAWLSLPVMQATA